MAKKKKSQMFDVCEVHLEGDTICDQFNNYLADHRKISDIITFLGIQNAALLQKNTDELSEAEKSDIVSFYVGFMEELGDLTYEARMENWGQEPLVFRVAEKIVNDVYLENMQKYYDSLPEFEKREAETLMETLVAIRKDRHIYLDYVEDALVVDIPRTLPRDELESLRRELRCICGCVVHERGVVITHLFHKNGEDVFGIMIMPNGMWRPLSAEEMKEAYCTTASGFELEPEEGQRFTEIQRERF